MKAHQPTNSKLLDFVANLLEATEIQGITCAISLKENRIRAEIERLSGSTLMLGAYLPYLKGYPNEEKIVRLEEELFNEMSVYFRINEILAKAKLLSELELKDEKFELGDIE